MKIIQCELFMTVCRLFSTSMKLSALRGVVSDNWTSLLSELSRQSEDNAIRVVYSFVRSQDNCFGRIGMKFPRKVHTELLVYRAQHYSC